jgi:hypothetical protein
MSQPTPSVGWMSGEGVAKFAINMDLAPPGIGHISEISPKPALVVITILIARPF